MRERIGSLGFFAATIAALAGCGVGGGGGGGGATVMAPPPFSITTAALAPMTVGTPYSQAVDSTGGKAPFQWIATAPAALPPGITVAASGASSTVLAGTPGASGNYTFEVRVHEGGGRNAARTFSVIVSGPLAIATATLAGAAEESPYAARVDATGGRAPYAWSIVSGQLPPGLGLAPSSGASVGIAGTPTQNGTFDFTIEVQDADARAGRAQLTIDVENTFDIYMLADLETPGFTELFRARSDGATLSMPVKISDSIVPTGGNVGLYKLSPDRTKVAYVADAEVLNKNEVYVVDLAKSPGFAEKVSQYAHDAVSVLSLAWSPDSRKLAYRADGDVDNRYEVYVADLGGGAPTIGRASTGTATGTGSEETYQWSPDSRYLAVRSEFTLQVGSPKQHLYVVDTAAGPPYSPVLVTTRPLTTSCEVRLINAWIPGTTTVLFNSNFENASRYDLFASTVTNGTPSAPTKVLENASGNFTAGQGADLSPDGKRLAAIAGIPGGSSDAVFVIDLSSGAPGTPVATTTAGDVAGYAWSADSTKLCLLYDPPGGTGDRRPTVVDVSAPAPWTLVEVSQDYVSPPQAYNFGFSPDGRWVWYRAGLTGPDIGYVVDISGTTPGAPQQFMATPVTTSSLAGLQGGAPVGDIGAIFSPDSTQIAFISAHTSEKKLDLYLNDTSAATPGAAEQISPTTTDANPSNTGATRIAWSIDSRFVILRGNWAQKSVYRLYAFDVQSGVPLTGLTDLTPALDPAATGVTSFLIDE